MLYELNYPMLIERSINANPMVYVDVLLEVLNTFLSEYAQQ